MTDDDVRAMLTDRSALALTLWGEARSEPIEGIVAVGSVIRNRLETPGRFGDTYRAICFAPWQFSCWTPKGGESNYQAVMALARELTSGEPRSRNALLRQCLWVAGGLMDGDVISRVKAATHYYSPAAMSPKGKVPEWAKGKTPVAIVGRHRFFDAVK